MGMRILRKELWPYRVRINSDTVSDITPLETWLGEKLGQFKGEWNVVYQYNHTDFYFKQQGNATMFALKWR